MTSADALHESVERQDRSNYMMVSIKRTGLSIISGQVELMQEQGASEDIISRATALQEIAQRDLDRWTRVSATFLAAHEAEIYDMARTEMETSGKALNY